MRAPCLKSAVILAVVATRAASRFTFLPATYFEPKEYGYEVLSGDTDPKYFPDALKGFNPGLARLPKKVAEELGRARATVGKNSTGGATEPTFVSTFRVRGNLCPYLSEEATGPVVETQELKKLRGRRRLNEPGLATYAAILDEELRVVDLVVDEEKTGELWDLGRDDVRLLSRPEYGSYILTSSMDYPFIGNTKEWYAEWRTAWLELSVDLETARVTGKLVPVIHPQVKGQGVIVNGRNFGIMWDGTGSDDFRLIHWLKTSLDVRTGVPAPKPDETAVSSAVLASQNKSLHNNINPIALDTLCPGLMLTIGHMHLDSAMPAYRWRTFGATGSGNTYAHVFVVFTKDPPYRVCAQSAPFCFPAVDHPQQCHVIEFITGALLLRDGNVLITYGVNDCQSAHVTVKLEDIIRFTMSDASCLCNHVDIQGA